MLSGKVKVDEPGVVVTEEGGELRVSLSGEGALWHFAPGDRWTVSRADGAVLFSGTVVGEALQWEQVTGFVRLDDGRPVAYNLDIDDNWYVYPAEEMCRLAGYWAKGDTGSIVTRGFVEVAAICVDELGIIEGIPETP
jgi:hypothetical protein